MRSYGITGAAVPDTRGVPLPTTVTYANHVTGQPARDPLAASPFRGQPVVEFTREQLAAAGYTVPGIPQPKRPAPHGVGPRGHIHRFDHDAAIAAYLGGESSTSIAKRLDVTAASVRGAIRQAGHEIRPSSNTPRAPRDRTATRRFDHDAAVTAYEAGATVPALAAEHGVSEQAIRRALRGRVTLRPTVEWDRAAAVQEYLDGDSSSVVAHRHGVSDSTIRDAVTAAGHQVRPTGSHNRSHIDDAEVARLYTAELLSPPQIAARLGITAKTVRKSLDDHGVPRRDDRARFSGGANAIPDTVLEQAGRLYVDGLTRTEVAARLGVHVRVVDKGIAHVGATPRPAANVPGAYPGHDHAAGLKDLMAANHVTSAQVRAWARTTGRDCSDVGIPARELVEAYLLATSTRRAS